MSEPRVTDSIPAWVVDHTAKRHTQLGTLKELRQQAGEVATEGVNDDISRLVGFLGEAIADLEHKLIATGYQGDEKR